jgi:hypothetical protein
MKLEFSRQIFEKYSDKTNHENPFSGRQIIPCGRMDELIDRTNVMVAFRNFTNASKTLPGTFPRCAGQ